MNLREFITSEIFTLLIARKMRAEQNANHPLARTCKDKHMAMMPSLLSIEAFERTGEELAAYGAFDPVPLILCMCTCFWDFMG